MIESYVVLAGRIRKELEDVERLVNRANRAVTATRRNWQDSDLCIDSASLSLHDAYSEFERLFRQIAAIVDGTMPSNVEWQKGLLEQMGLDLPKTRPPVLSTDSIQRLNEYLRFRHIVRNVYTFSFDPERIGRLVKELEMLFAQVRDELLTFAAFLEMVGNE
jgi:hypothetical protein